MSRSPLPIIPDLFVVSVFDSPNNHTIKMKSFATAAIAASLISAGAAKKCTNMTVPVTVNSRNALFDKDALTPHSNIDVTDFILNLSQQGHNYTMDQLKGVSVDREIVLSMVLTISCAVQEHPGHLQPGDHFLYSRLGLPRHRPAAHPRYWLRPQLLERAIQQLQLLLHQRGS